jgi:hypothetical protein
VLQGHASAATRLSDVTGIDNAAAGGSPAVTGRRSPGGGLHRVSLLSRPASEISLSHLNLLASLQVRGERIEYSISLQVRGERIEYIPAGAGGRDRVYMRVPAGV